MHAEALRSGCEARARVSARERRSDRLLPWGGFPGRAAGRARSARPGGARKSRKCRERFAAPRETTRVSSVMEARAPPAGDDARASFPYFLNADVSFEPRSDVDARVAVEATASNAGTRVDAAPPERARSPAGTSSRSAWAAAAAVETRRLGAKRQRVTRGRDAHAPRPRPVPTPRRDAPPTPPRSGRRRERSSASPPRRRCRRWRSAREPPPLVARSARPARVRTARARTSSRSRSCVGPSRTSARTTRAPWASPRPAPPRRRSPTPTRTSRRKRRSPSRRRARRSPPR